MQTQNEQTETVPVDPIVMLRVAAWIDAENKNGMMELSKPAPPLAPGVVWQVGLAVDCFFGVEDFIVSDIKVKRDGTVHVWLDGWDRDDTEVAEWIAAGWST